MLIDKELLLSDAQLVTTGSENGIDSTNIIDLGVARNIGVGEDLYVVVQIQTTLVGPSSDTLHVDLVTDDNEDRNSVTVVQRIGTFAANSVAGTRVIAKLPPVDTYERYLALKYTADDNALTAGKVDAFITTNIDAYRAYPAV